MGGNRPARLCSMYAGSHRAWLDVTHLVMQQFGKLSQSDNIHNREINLLQYVVMMVVSNNITGIRLNSTINKLVIISIGDNEIKTISGREE